MTAATAKRTKTTETATDLEQLVDTLATATARYQGEFKRIRDLKERHGQLTGQIAREPDETKRAELRTERDRITSDLFHAPGDVAALAGIYANALIAWATHAINEAEATIRSVNAELAEPERRYGQLAHRLSASRPVNEIDPVADNATRRELANAIEVLQPLQARIAAARAAHDQASSRLAMTFGGGTTGGNVPVGDLARFIDRARATARDEIGALGGGR
jgi:chromosome segregation ATPase